MDQEKFGKFIKEIRKKNNLTQAELASKYNVTYQAVSKWETGKNMPDMALIKQISKDFNVSLDELFEGGYKRKERKRKYLIPIFIFVIIMLILVITFIAVSTKDKDFEFKTLSSSCSNFKISGTISYNEKKSAIYISNIEYCGSEVEEKYDKIECTLYESSGNMDKKISSYKHDKGSISLDDFLKKVTFTVDNYDRVCDAYSKDSLYLLIDAQSKEENHTTYKVPLSIKSCD